MTSVENMMANGPSEKRIDLDFGEQRRRSFLPAGWNEDKPDTNIKVIEFHEDDDLYLYMNTDKQYIEKPVQKFYTGSKYLGQWNHLGFSGKGVYKYPHGVIYDGYFNRNGEFHGTGMLVYPNGQRIEGVWKNGKLGPDNSFVTKGGVVMNSEYCRMPDRRFQIEVENDFNPVGQEYETSTIPPPRSIPDGCYDAGEGFYDPGIKCVLSYNDIVAATVDLKDFQLFSGDDTRQSNFSKLLSEPHHNLKVLPPKTHEERKVISGIPSNYQEEWLVKNCRKAWDEPTGYRPDLYEEWTKGGTEGNDSNVCEGMEENDEMTILQFQEEERKLTQNTRYVSFIQNKMEHQESITIEVLTKMFLEKQNSPHPYCNNCTLRDLFKEDNSPTTSELMTTRLNSE